MRAVQELHHRLDAADGLIWIQSDLQMSNPERARQVLTGAVTDMLELGLPLDAVWCLGDALAGTRIAALEEVAETSIELLGRLDTPVYYVMGNHEMDVRRRRKVDRFPLYERALEHPDWHTHAHLSDVYFEADMVGCRVFFFGDHAAADGPWFTSHNQIRGDVAAYPHTVDDYRRLRQRMADSRLPVMTASHYSYPGGQRVGDLLVRLLPLPDTVYVHVYGHAHLGDYSYNKRWPHRRQNPIVGQDLPKQYNISALETRRSAGSHSALLLVSGGIPTWLAVRDHLTAAWVDGFAIRPPR